PGPEQMRAMGEAVLELVIRFVEARATAPAQDLDHPVRAPETNDLDALLAYLGDAAARAVDTAGPGYQAYIPGGGLYTPALAGYPPAALRIVPADANLRIDLAALREAIERDSKPFLVVASAGTTTTGAVDPLDDLATLAQQHGLWLHVDAAYGGFFQLTERGKQKLKGIERADSITLDPHKGMFLPYGSGCLIVRDGERLRAGHAAGAEYLQDLPDVGLPNYAE